MAIPDQPFDELLETMLKTETVVTRRQQEAAWERLYVQAQRQVMLTPYATAPPIAGRPAYRGLMALVSRLCHLLFFDDRVYQRAADRRDQLPIATMIGFSIIIHYPPVRYQRY